jgi:PAS domain S-box-containing protein
MEGEKTVEYQEAKELLEDKTYLFDSIMGSLGDMVSIQDINMRVVYQSEALKKVMGHHAGEFCYTAYEKKDKICEGCPIQAAYKDGGIHRAVRVGILPDGTQRRFENGASVLKNKQGKIIAGVEVIRDVEERESIKEDLEKSEKRFMDMAFSMADWLWEVDEKGIYTYCSERVKDILGYTAEEVIGKSPFNFMPPSEVEKVGKIFSEIVGNKQPIHDLENWSLTKDGRQVCLLTNGVPTLDKQGNLTGYRGVDKDITERKHAEKEKERLQARLLQTDKMAAVGQLAAGVAHEINNPLGIILGFAQGAVKRVKEGDPLTLPLKTIEREAVRCKDLVQNLLMFSRAQKSEQQEFIDLDSIVVSALALVEAQTKTRNVELVSKLEAGLPKICADKTQIQQVIINLANNAIDAMPGGGKLTVKTLLSDKWPGHVGIQVRDTGTGIPKQLEKKIFEPFFTTKEIGKGTGLGLSMVYEIVNKHGGTIQLESEEGKGAAFTIFLPVKPAENGASHNVKF